MDMKEVIDIVFPIIGVLALYILNDLKKSVDKATQSVASLNEKVGVIIEKTERHDKEIEDMKNNHTQTRDRLHDLGNHINRINVKLEKD